MVGGSCGYENKNFTQSLSECQGPVTGIGVWLRGMRIPIHLALWLKMSLSLSLKLECERTVCSGSVSGKPSFIGEF